MKSTTSGVAAVEMPHRGFIIQIGFNAAGTPKSIHIDESLPCHTLRAHAILINSLEHRQELVVDFLFMRYLIITNEW